MAVPTQLASIVAWDDDQHAAVNRRLYQEKFDKVLPFLADVLPVKRPAGAFYLWTDVGMDDEQFVRELFAEQNVTVLPGSYLARAAKPGANEGSPGAGRSSPGDGRISPGANTSPGARRIRISLVPGVADCVEATERIRNFMRGRR
jgi:N-succinyldiaminopimelate aminotransferase